MANADLIARIESLYFGDANIEYLKFIRDIFSCTKLEHFNKLNINFESEKISELFSNASRKQSSMIMTASKSKELFTKLKAFKSDSCFI